MYCNLQKAVCRGQAAIRADDLHEAGEPDAEGAMTDATVGAGSHQVRYSTSIFGLQVLGRQQVSHWHCKPSPHIPRSGIRVVRNNTQAGDHCE